MLASALVEALVFVPGKAEAIKLGELPCADSIHLLQRSTILSQLDPGVLEYHAEGRAREIMEGLEPKEILVKINCPVLLLQGNPSQGGMMTNASIEYALPKLKSATHVLIEPFGHGLGLYSWEAGLLLRAVSTFFES